MLAELEKSVVLLEVVAVCGMGMAKDTASQLRLLWRRMWTVAQWYQRGGSGQTLATDTCGMKLRKMVE